MKQPRVHVAKAELGEFSRAAMQAYGSYVLLDRAVSDARDGLKPVQRRILWAMQDLKLSHSGNFKKSAKVVGEVIGSYHPHGDQAVYQTMVNMIWDRYPLIDGHGNFGSPTDNAAAMRYTEARLSPLASEIFNSDDIAVADMVDNYSGDKKEPLVLPARVPVHLLNGMSGIGVGLRTSIPPHNLRELIQALIYFIKKENPKISSVLKYLHGPDYGYGVLLSEPTDIESLYATGKGTLRFRCEYEFEEHDDGPVLVVKSLAPGFNMGVFLSKMRKLSDDKLIDFCSDSSSAKGVCIYVGFKDAVVLRDRVLPELYTTQSYEFSVVKRPAADAILSSETLLTGNLFLLFEEFVEYRRTIEKLRLERAHKYARAELHKATAILAAIQNLDAVYDVLRAKYDSVESMAADLASRLSISEAQAQVVLNMKVHQLARMQEQSQLSEIENINERIATISADLNDIDGVIIRHLKSIHQYADDRKTKLAVDAPVPEFELAESSKWVTASGAKVLRLVGDVDRRVKFDFVVRSNSLVTAVYENNNARALHTSFFTEEVGDKPCVGLVSDEAKLLVCIDTSGKGVIVEHPPRKTEYNLIKGATKLVQAVGLRPGDSLVVMTDEDEGAILPFSTLKGTRPFVHGYNIHPQPRSSIVKLAVLPANARLYDSKGNSISSTEFTVDSDGMFVVGKKNAVAVKGKRDVLDHKSVVAAIKAGELEQCWLLD